MSEESQKPEGLLNRISVVRGQDFNFFSGLHNLFRLDEAESIMQNIKKLWSNAQEGKSCQLIKFSSIYTRLLHVAIPNTERGLSSTPHPPAQAYLHASQPGRQKLPCRMFVLPKVHDTVVIIYLLFFFIKCFDASEAKPETKGAWKFQSLVFAIAQTWHGEFFEVWCFSTPIWHTHDAQRNTLLCDKAKDHYMCKWKLERKLALLRSPGLNTERSPV